MVVLKEAENPADASNTVLNTLCELHNLYKLHNSRQSVASIVIASILLSHRLGAAKDGGNLHGIEVSFL